MHRGIVSSALIALVATIAGAALAEQDHLLGYRAKDLNAVQSSAPHTITTRVGDAVCELRKAQFYLAPGEKDGGDDPRGGPAADFVCYKAKCTAPPLPVTAGDSQLGALSLSPSKKAKIVCLPLDTLVCGDGNVDPGEACDGTDAAACGSGTCLADCTCAPQSCGNGIREDAEECDGSDATSCPEDCQADCSCAVCAADVVACTVLAFASSGPCHTCCAADSECQTARMAAVSNLCGNEAANAALAAAANAAGCAVECCAGP